MSVTIYKITNKKNGYVYIGQTKRNLSIRLSEHFKVARNGNKVNSMYEDMRRQPAEDFAIEKLAVVTYTDRFIIEAEFTKFAKQGDCYNIAEGVCEKKRSKQHKEAISAKLKGRTFSDETRKKMSASAKGKKKGPQSEEHKRNAIAARIYNRIKRKLEAQIKTNEFVLQNYRR